MAAKDILLVLILSCFCFFDSLAADTLNKGEAFNTSSSLVSQNRIFTLGFQRLGTVDANSSYLGIWFNNGTSKKPFWLANRDKPIADDSGILAIEESGNLKLKYSGGDVVELYSSQSSSANLQAVLENSGNFVLKDANSGGEQILWQSFDFPTDTFLPGMKLGTNRTSRQTWSLASWLSDYVPTSGPFTLEWQATGNQLVVKRRGVMFRTSGPLLGNEGFQQIPVNSESLGYSFRNVSNADEDYLQYSVATNMYSAADQLNFTMWAMNFDGSLIIEGQSATRVPLLADTCDGNNTEYGCERWEGPSCRSTNEDKFALRAGHFIGSVVTRLDDNVSLSISDCKDICWKECDCVGIGTENTNKTGCRFWDGEFIPDPTGQQSATYVIIQDTEISPIDASGTRSWIWILAAVAVVLIMILLGVFLYWRRRKRKEKLLNELLTSDTANDRRELESDGNKGHNLNVYSAATIMAATNSFSFENKLGQGGFGPVYKGKLPDGREIAVKRLSRSSGQGLGEFKNELILIAKLQHSNLVRLLGCCIEGEQKMLVYEYMPNKSLDSFIFDQTKRELLDWTKRFEIIEGIAQGLIYLHKHSRVRIIHRDMKASNILLDESMNPKISDFGMARIFNTNSLEENTNRIVGTYGYMSPEYAMEGIFSVKSDVFSFGVLVLEIVSGRKNHGIIQMDHPVNLVGYAWELWKEGEALKLVDPKIKDSCHKEQVLRCINVGLLCVEENALDRPTMSDVITMLTSEVAQLPMPKHPAFPTARRIVDIEKSMSSKAESSSGNGISMSTMYGR